MRRSFERRSVEAELMEGEDVRPKDLRACLRDLETVNTLTLARRPTLAWLDRAIGDSGAETVSLLDVGSGRGDFLRRTQSWGRRRGVTIEAVGVDLNPLSAVAAREATPSGLDIAYHTADIFAFDPGRRFDFVVSSLFTHHLSDEAVVRFLRWMERAAVRGWFVNDLHRHAIPFHGFRLMARIAGWHRFVRHDGPVSIARGFRRADWLRFLEAADLDRSAVEIGWHMPFRLCVGRLK
ncbi:methyltransferase domain-containing protein [Inquilinus sp. CAU 1745]|uniref:methyltransferase domain-containing protein n=1 Tax=Inquilinus sp. CAU 1745 TaxID=3140369 RepID=UPI00325A4DAF